MTRTDEPRPVPGPPRRLSSPPVTRALREYLSTESGSAVLLLCATAVALVWANSPWSESYAALWSTEAAVEIGGSAIRLDLRHWINDGLMVLFFLSVGLEITRELVIGELRDRRSATVPAFAAVGGMALPALIFLALNAGTDASRGWGIPMATDIAFVLGALALLGPRCPDRLRLFLLTLAIVDDIGAILVIAVFYTDDLAFGPLVMAGVLLAALAALRWLRIWRTPAYALLGFLLWAAVLASGVHPTIAGVLLAMVISARPPAPRELRQAGSFTRALQEEPTADRARLASLAAAATVSPNERLQLLLHPWTSYVIVPVFALANAGVPLNAAALQAAATSPLTVGIVAGLVVGKAVGITAATWLALRLGLGASGSLLDGIRYGQLVGGASLAGIGFTVALFITDLAFDDPALRELATIGVLAGSALAALLGWSVFRFLAQRGGLCAPPDAEGALRLPPRPWREPA